MDSDVLAAIIGAVATVVGAAIGALLGRSDFLDKLFRGSKFTSITGKWESTWVDLNEAGKTSHRENFVITRQRGSRIYGYITMEEEPDKKWEFEGNFSGRFLQLFYYPSKDAEDKLFLDYGCYFFDMLGDGTFVGYSVGFDWQENATDVSKHKLRRVR
jgi:hypothetical protein